MDLLPPLSPAPRDLHRERIRFGAPLIAVIFIFLCTFAVQLIVMSLVALLAPSLASRDWYLIVLSSVPMYAVAMPLSLLIFRLSPASAPTEKKRLGAPAFLGLISLCFATTYVGNIIGTVVNIIFSLLTRRSIVNELQELTLSTPLWANLLFCGILAPILEEIFFRKLIIDRLRHYGDLPAVLISGLLFGLVHGNFNQFFYAAAIGLFFGYIYLYTGRLRYSIALHMIVNLVGGVYATEVMRRLDFDALAENMMAYISANPIPILMYLAQLAFVGICCVCAPIAIALFWKQIRFRKSPMPLSAAEWRAVTLKNPAVWIALVAIALMFLI